MLPKTNFQIYKNTFYEFHLKGTKREDIFCDFCSQLYETRNNFFKFRYTFWDLNREN